jgi:hypothetical protein
MLACACFLCCHCPLALFVRKFQICVIWQVFLEQGKPKQRKLKNWDQMSPSTSGNSPIVDMSSVPTEDTGSEQVSGMHSAPWIQLRSISFPLSGCQAKACMDGDMRSQRCSCRAKRRAARQVLLSLSACFMFFVLSCHLLSPMPPPTIAPNKHTHTQLGGMKDRG